MTPQSCKAKGRSFQKEVVSLLLKTFPTLTENDIKSTSMGCSGADIQLSEAALQLFPFDVECKKVEKLNIWSAMKQAITRCEESRKPVVFFRKNRSDTYVCLRAEDFLTILGKDQG